jgi:hypothetical protein
VKLFYTAGIRIHRANTAQCNDFFAQDGKGFFKVVLIPDLEQSHIQADMIGM